MIYLKKIYTLHKNKNTLQINNIPIGVSTGSATCTGGTSTWTSSGSINDACVQVTNRNGSPVPN